MAVIKNIIVIIILSLTILLGLVLAVYAFLKTFKISQKRLRMIMSISTAILLIFFGFAGYGGVEAYLYYQNETNRLIKESDDLITSIKEPKEKFKITLGKYYYKITKNGSETSYEAGLPVTMKNQANYPVLVDYQVVAKDETGQVIETTGWSGSLKAKESKTVEVFGPSFDVNKMKKMQTAFYSVTNEDVMKDMTSKP